MGVGIVIATVCLVANPVVDVAYTVIEPRVQVGG